MDQGVEAVDPAVYGETAADYVVYAAGSGEDVHPHHGGEGLGHEEVFDAPGGARAVQVVEEDLVLIQLLEIRQKSALKLELYVALLEYL